MTLMAVDPGATGGIAVMAMEGESAGTLVHVEPWVDPYRFADLLERYVPTMVFVEKVGARPGQGVVSMFSFGCRFGEIIGALAAMNQPHTLVPPQTWAKVMHAGTKDGKPKERSLEAARRLFPYIELRDTDTKSKKPHPGIVDAALLVEYGRRITSPKA